MKGRKQEMKIKMKVFKSLIVLICILSVSSSLLAGNKKIMTTRAAMVVAERALVESVHGFKLRGSESVVDMIAAGFKGTAESKTSYTIKGVKFEKVNYDAEADIAQVIAYVKLPSIKTIEGDVINLNNKVFKRVGFASSTPKMAPKLKALRAAEIDAYMRLIKRIIGFKLESHTTVENFMLTSDEVKTKVHSTLCMAELKAYDWDELGDATVIMSINVKDISDMLGEKIVGIEDDFVVVEGQGAAIDDFKLVEKQ